MKPQTRSNLIAILFGCAMLLFIWLFHNEKQARKEAEAISEQFILNKNKELADRKKEAENMALSYQVTIDSLQSVFLSSEKKRKTNAIYFQNEITKLKMVNTFNARIIYLDSLEGANGLR